VWQPMHLSRFSTIAICARIFIGAPCEGRNRDWLLAGAGVW
jgi:hypothetical protein